MAPCVWHLQALRRKVQQRDTGNEANFQFWKEVLPNTSLSQTFLPRFIDQVMMKIHKENLALQQFCSPHTSCHQLSFLTDAHAEKIILASRIQCLVTALCIKCSSKRGQDKPLIRPTATQVSSASSQLLISGSVPCHLLRHIRDKQWRRNGVHVLMLIEALALNSTSNSIMWLMLQPYSDRCNDNYMDAADTNEKMIIEDVLQHLEAHIRAIWFTYLNEEQRDRLNHAPRHQLMASAAACTRSDGFSLGNREQLTATSGVIESNQRQSIIISAYMKFCHDIVYRWTSENLRKLCVMTLKSATESYSSYLREQRQFRQGLFALRNELVLARRFVLVSALQDATPQHGEHILSSLQQIVSSVYSGVSSGINSDVIECAKAEEDVHLCRMVQRAVACSVWLSRRDCLMEQYDLEKHLLQRSRDLRKELNRRIQQWNNAAQNNQCRAVGRTKEFKKLNRLVSRKKKQLQKAQEHIKHCQKLIEKLSSIQCFR